MSGGGATSDDRPETGDAAAAGGGRRRTGAPLAGETTPIVVTWNERQRRPVSFLWRRRRYRVERVLETWVLETGWWKDEGHVSRSYWRVRAEGRVFDLRYDRLSKAWALEQALN
jgi:Domain of unknown function (DUF6504)